MAVKLMGLPSAAKQKIAVECKYYFQMKISEYFKSAGEEITTLAGLRERQLWFLMPSGNRFIYRALSWLARTPIQDDEEWVPERDRCTFKVDGCQCFRREGHTTKHRMLMWAEVESMCFSSV